MLDLTISGDLQCGNDAQSNSAGDFSCAEKIDVEQLFKEHYNQLLWFVQRYVRNIDDARDVVQSTFVESIRCASHFSGKSKPSTWLFGIALNLAHNHVRRSGRNQMDAVGDNMAEEIAAEQLDPCRLLEQRQMVANIAEILTELPAKIRDTFEAVFDGESSYEDAARQMQIPVGTVRSRVSRVRNKMRACFA